MSTPKNAEYKKRQQYFKRRLTMGRSIAPRIGNKLWSSDGQGYTAFADGSLRRINDPMPPGLWTQVRKLFATA